MEVGLLWLDNDSRRGVEDKVKRAASHYQKKYGCMPNLCFVHPSMLGGNGKPKPLHVDKVEVRSVRSMLPDHFWLGVEDE